MTVGVLPQNDGEVGGCLFTSRDVKPSDAGALIYLNAIGRLDAALATVQPTAAKFFSRNIRSGRSVFARSFSIAKATG